MLDPGCTPIGEFAGAVAPAGVDPTLEGRALQDALRRGIANRRGYCSWDVDHATWVVSRHSPEEQDSGARRWKKRSHGAWCG